MAILATASLIGVALALISLEALLALALRGDLRTPEIWRKARREYYMGFERHILQFLPECARFDPQLGYRLKPGHCRFQNPEYDHDMFVNPAGLRDREEASIDRRSSSREIRSRSAGVSLQSETDLAARRALPPWISELQVIDPASFLTASDYDPIDEHLNAAGYRKIAAAVVDTLSERR